MKNAQHSWSVVRGALSLLCAACCALPSSVFAAPEGVPDGPITDLLEASIPDAEDKGQGLHDKLAVEMSALKPLPGGYRNKGSQDGGSTSGQPEQELGPNPKPATSLHLPAMKGFRELADAQPVQEMFKGLVTKKVPVLFQTMMMVENGAATGFIGSMQAVSNVLSNQVQTTQLSFQLDDMLDPSGQLKYNHGGAIVNSLSGGDDVKTWPHALWDASGDNPTGSAINAIEKTQEKPPHDAGDRPGDPNKGKTEKLELDLAKDLLFPQRPQDDPEDMEKSVYEQYKYDESGIEKLEKEFFTYVGNIKQKQQPVNSGSDKLAVQNFETLYKGEEKDKRWGLERRAYEESKEVWKNLNTLVNKLCKFKKQNNNLSKKPEEKEFASIAAQFEAKEWKGASAPDIRMTEILLEQIFLISKPGGSYEDLKCEEDYSTSLEFPNGAFKELDANEPDSCKGGGGAGGGVKGCMRLRVINHISTLIGRSRALHYFDAMQNVTARFVQDPVAARMHQALFAHVIGTDPISTHIDQNRDSYERFMVYLARYTQGNQSTGTVFRPGGRNALPSAGQGGYGDSKS